MSVTEAPSASPRSCTELFLTFNRLALQGFGGVLAVAQVELVERRRWLSKEEFVELLSISQVLPGPNIVNLCLAFGDRHFGARGALAALAGLITVPLVIVLALTLLYARFSQLPMVAGALRGMGAVAAGLILSTALKLAGPLRRNPMGWPLCAALAGAACAGIALLRLPLVWVIFGLGLLAVGLAWRRIAP
jgi:chromate transporter